MSTFEDVIKDTWTTETERFDFWAHAIRQAMSDPAIHATNQAGLYKLEEFANGRQGA